MTGRLNDVVASTVEATAYTIPTDSPEADGTIAWDRTTLVLVWVTADGVVGTGWTYTSAAAAPLIRDTLAPVVEGSAALATVGTWGAMVRALRNIGRTGLGGMALSAVDTALWDLRARLLALRWHSEPGQRCAPAVIRGAGVWTDVPG